jgi:hypothetical protein
MSFTDPQNARFAEQRKVMEESEKSGECPFCWNYLERYHLEPILKKGQFWLVTANHWPYEFTRHQFLLIYRDHAENIIEIDAAAGAELLELTTWLIKEYNIKGGGLSMRFGETQFSAASVKHLHAQLIEPDANHPEFEPVRVKLGAKRSQ